MEKEYSFSVIIPTLNEAETIGACISNIITADPTVEVIVADGDSSDATRDIAEASGAIALHTEPCRGLQCNLGAAAASGKILVFLHADTIVPDGTFDKLGEIFKTDEVKIGNFIITFDTRHLLLRVLSSLARLDFGFFRFGDQGIAVRKTFFDDLGGFPDWSLFEDFAFMRKARKQTRIHRLPVPVITSSRRFTRNGIIRQQLRNTYYTLQYMLGIPPWKLAEKYYGMGLNSWDTSLVILARFPESGNVKTRLAKTLGPEIATMFYRSCTEHVLEEAKKLPHGVTKYVYYTPKRSKESMQRWAGPGFHFRSQASGDLGKRLKAVFRDQFSTGMEKVIVVATDVPDISACDIEEAVRSLDKADLVLGPSGDGGYYLIGMNKPYPHLFDGILWSTDVVYEQTICKANELGLETANLRTIDDIDTEEDFHRWLKRTDQSKSKYVKLEERAW